MIISKTIFPLNGSGFSGILSISDAIPNNTTWEVTYNQHQFSEPQMYLNICKAKTGNSLLVKSLQFNTSVEQLNTTLIKFVRRLITGMYISSYLKLKATSKMYQGVQMVSFPGDISLGYETSLELNISPNTTVTMFINYEKTHERIFPEIPGRSGGDICLLS